MKSNSLKQRNSTIDIAKAIGIILMVWVHARGPYEGFISLFHMALFFIIAGFVFKPKYFSDFDNLKSFFTKKVKRLYFPFVTFNLILILLHNLFIKINIYTNNPEFLLYPNFSRFGLSNIYSLSDLINNIILCFSFYNRELLSGATWFLCVLFWINVISCIGMYLCKGNRFAKYMIPIGYICAFILGCACQHYEFKVYRIGTMLTCSMIFYAGFLYSKYKERIPLNIISCVIYFLIIMMIHLYIPEGINVVGNIFHDPVSFLLASIFGSLFVINLSELISKSNIMNTIFSYIGQKTMPILMFHFIAFKFITILQVYLYKSPILFLASFPVYISDGVWWTIYTVTGILIPIVCSELFNVSKKFLHIQ